MTKKISKKTAAVALMGALAVPVGWAIAPASAESTAPATIQIDTDQVDADQADTGQADTVAPDVATRRADRRAERQKLVADRLGVTPEQLRDARLDVLHDQLDQRVASGRITQERADQILDAAKAGKLQELRRELRAQRAAGR